MKDKDKIRFAVRVFLCANKGKRYTSKQLCTSANVARLLTGNWLQSKGITRERKDKRNVWHYGVV